MALPKQSDLEIPFLQELSAVGECTPQELYERLKSQFKGQELEERLSTGEYKWRNWIRWTKQRLVRKGEVESTFRGNWKITPKGAERLESL